MTTWELMEMMINEGFEVSDFDAQDRKAAVEWLEEQPLASPPQVGVGAGSAMVRRPLFQLLEDHEGADAGDSTACMFCARTLYRGGTVLDLETNLTLTEAPLGPTWLKEER